MRPVIFASFATTENAEKALGALLDHGVLAKDISVIFPESYKHNELVASADKGITTTTAEDAGAGAAKGAGIGLGVGALAAVASLLVPGFGLVVGGGALATALAGTAGATAAGAIAGGVTGYLKDQGVPGELGENYSRAISEGGAVVGVSTPSNDVGDTVVREVFIKYNGRDIQNVEMAPRTAAVPIGEPIEEREPIVVDTASGERIE